MKTYRIKDLISVLHFHYYLCLILYTISGMYLCLQAQPAYDSTFQPVDTPIVLNAVNVEAYHMSIQLRTVPGSLSVLNAHEIQSADGTNLSDVLNTLPGVTMQSGTYTTNRIVIRGMGSRTPYNTNRIRTYLNDIPLTTSDGLSTPEEIDMQSFGRIEIIKGPSSALYGSGLGGSINLYTPAQEENGGSLNLQYGTFNTLKAGISGNYQYNKSSLWATVNHLQSDGYRENSSYKRTSFITTASFNQRQSKIDFLLFLTGVNGGIPSSIGKTLFEENPRAAASNWKAIEGYKKYTRGILGISLTNKITPRLTNKLALFGRGTDSYERRPFNNLDDQSLSLGLRNKITLQYDKINWIFGAEWIIEEYRWRLDTNSVVINLNRENRSQLNLFAMAYFRPSTEFNISLAGAVNYINYRLTDLYANNGFHAGDREFPLIISPRLGINYSPYNRIAFYASAGYGFSLPSPEEALLPQGDINPDIKHEQGLQFEIGSRLNFALNRIGLEVVLYWIELNDLLVTKRVTEDVFTGINAGKTRHQGIELTLNSNILNISSFPGKLNTTFSYSQSLNRFIKFTDDGNNYDGNHLPGIPDQVLYLLLEWHPVKLLRINVDLRYNGAQYLDDGNLIRYEHFIISNLKISSGILMRKVGQLNLFGGINNIGNASYASMLIVNAIGFNGSEPRYFYPGLPINGYVGVQFTF